MEAEVEKERPTLEVIWGVDTEEVVGLTKYCVVRRGGNAIEN